jgi:hypothetical protein
VLDPKRPIREADMIASLEFEITRPINIQNQTLLALTAMGVINFARLKWNRRNHACKPSLCGEEDLLRGVPTWARNV